MEAWSRSTASHIAEGGKRAGSCKGGPPGFNIVPHMWAGSCRKEEQTNFTPLWGKIWKAVADSPDPYASAVRVLEVLRENRTLLDPLASLDQELESYDCN